MQSKKSVVKDIQITISETCVKGTFYVSKNWSNTYRQGLTEGIEAMEIITAVLFRRKSSKHQENILTQGITTTQKQGEKRKIQEKPRRQPQIH